MGAGFGTICVAMLLTADAALDAAVSAPVLTATTWGRPVAAPCTWIFAALTICSAARFTLPETRMPASPASMVPKGAIRSTSPGGTSAIGAKVPIPAPDDGTDGDKVTLP